MHDADRFPLPNARYRDTHGRIVIITGIDSGRVVYMRQVSIPVRLLPGKVSS
ncbi:DUF4222 domain-containing protein [Edwardsiella tarda]|uniref:DUF4222 domain-containing protein n=1 Tax=Edwardsiella tarda TaxID=636 RepID=UPI00351C7D20